MPARTTKSHHKLLHALVAVGAALTGGTTVACSAGDTPLASDAGKEAAIDGPYGTIDASYPQIRTRYGTIMAESAPDAADRDSQVADADVDADAGDAGMTPDADYPRIMPACGSPAYPCR
jgi:hypothetical protein